MRRFVTMALLACLAFLQMNAEILSNDEVTLVVSADGASKDEAVKLALRSAIEQTYGAFVSSNTVLLNDELIKDELVTVSSGNVKEYKELTSNKLPNGRTYVTLQATVSISNLIRFAQSKGAKVEFDGANLAMNIQLEELNTRSQEKVLDNLMIQLSSLVHNGYDYSVKLRNIENRQFQDKTWYELRLEIVASSNKNFDTAIELIKRTLKSLSVPKSQRITTVQYQDYLINSNAPNLNTITLRYSGYTMQWFESIISLFNQSVNNICIADGRSECNAIGLSENGYYWNGIGNRIDQFPYAYWRGVKGYDHKGLWIKKGKRKGEVCKKIFSQSELKEYKDFEVKPMYNNF